eukprot:CAMPEP_0196796294 /NCGR_PEP_ID=MMETSP1104-20130614/37333_1 /TAXON_ID=33652 /ORGANISM="Cafeteria sp., Strain Caron Lab Isolate" /LENGTH=81 /DNA_ID=CAMNT_0042166685 /DNA_START=24 /DNA_END=265 /DNA_ORIENTATION=-
MDSSTSFSTLMQQAAKIKGAEMDRLRTRFNSWPQHLQNSLFYDDGALRGQSVSARLEEAGKRKKAAAALLEEEQLLDALNV